MKRRLLLIGAAGLLTLGGAFSTMAAQPNHPGCFGQDRAAGVEALRNAATAPGASAWGHEAANRGGTNGAQNNAYKAYCQSLP